MHHARQQCDRTYFSHGSQHSSCHVPRQRRPPLRLATVEDVPRGGAVPPLLRNKTPVEAVWTVAWPSVAIGLLRTALGQTDAWYIGRLGKKELEAMGAASFGVWLVYLLGEVGPSACKLWRRRVRGLAIEKVWVGRSCRACIFASSPHFYPHCFLPEQL